MAAIGGAALLHIVFNVRFIERVGSVLVETRRMMDGREGHEKTSLNWNAFQGDMHHTRLSLPDRNRNCVCQITFQKP